MCHSRIRVIVADDHPIVSLGVSHELARDPTIEVIGCARDSTDLMTLLEAQPCDVVVSDYTMPGGKHGDGLGLIGLLRRRFPQLHVAVLTMVDHPTLLRALLTEKKLCILSKADSTRHIIEAIHAMMRGRTYYSPTIKDMIIRESLSPAQPRLTRREAEIVRLFCAGTTITEISRISSRSVQTISSQKRSAMRKLGIARDADLIRYGNTASLDQFLLPETFASPLDDAYGLGS
ncbi:response regulator transcription factor [Achromobacter sp. SD115]|uniref:response regulator transcription factor n=1 Tax=Achromobacter sp. SD115 TaxID=2782011 RepID=UPI001A971D60|nr:response regulator transcription factor [Achromobacter sp. SD115]MBO1014513.1 response regulator transcription factor [Achromobacter sp. SD115]